MKSIQNIGLVLFLASLGLFIGVLFTGSYQVSELRIANLGNDDKSILLKAELEKSAEAVSKFEMLAIIDNAIKKTNSKIEEKYKIDVAIIDQLIADKNEITYDLSLIDGLSLQEDKRQKIKDYTGWMQGQTFSVTDFKEKLQSTFNSINGGIISNFGIDDYTSKEVKTQVLKATSTGLIANKASALFFWIFIFGAISALIYILPNLKLLGGPGIKNNDVFKNPMTSRKWLGILTGSLLILFYIVLYWFPYYLTEWMIITEPFANWVSGGGSSQWFVYGLLYTVAVLVMGIRMLIKYRHSKYHLVRTGSVMFFQLAFAFIIPQLLAKNSLPALDLKNMWPLDYSFFFDYRLDQMFEAGTIGFWMLGWGILLFVIGVPTFTYIYGKRWYCSWVCGCGGLAETLGDPYRQLSDKSVKAWKIERWMIHSVLVFAVVMTALVLYTYKTGESTVLGLNSYSVRGWYGFFIGSAFSGVVGTGFYPLMGNRTWCRFGCPLAAYLGIIQRFKSRFRITTNGGQCISCGNCSYLL